MKISLITDTWSNVNGVATTLHATVNELKARGHEVQVIEPTLFKTISAPSYKEVRLSWNIWKVWSMIRKFDPDSIHIATEGPLGFAARLYCSIGKKVPHNTSYHTKFPEYLKLYYGLPLKVGYWLMRLFHKYSEKVLVTTESMKIELEQHGFKNLVVWNRGVDRDIFNSSTRKSTLASKPVLLCVSRASEEKGLDDFCSLKTTGTKILVGDGPYLKKLKEKYPDVIFTGYKKGLSLAHYYANSDVFIFPSRTDTFGVVMIEALACGTPIAAYPVTGPIDIVKCGINGDLSESLTSSIEKCLLLNRSNIEENSKGYCWKSCTDIFEKNLVKITKT